MKASEGGPDIVVMARAYKQDDLDNTMDHKYKTMALFLPQCGVFRCCRKRRHEDVGLVNTLIPLDMSWPRLMRGTNLNGSVSYTLVEQVCAAISLANHVGGNP